MNEFKCILNLKLITNFIRPHFLIALAIFLSVSCQGQPSIKEEVIELRTVINSGQYPNIDGILVAVKDKVIVEEYFNGFDQESRHDTRSSFKSITSLLAGIAIDKGLFSTGDSMRIFFKEWQNDLRGNITIKDLLQMKSGLASECFFEIGPCAEEEMWDTDNWLEFILEVPLKHNPGLNWAYTSIEPELIGEIIQRTSQMSLIEFANQNLFEPLSISDYKWHITPEGRGYAAGSFSIRPSDMLKISQLVLNKGEWKGQRIISEKWIDESTDCQTDVEMSFVRFSRMKNAKYSAAKYGYLWYREILQYRDVKTEVLFASGNGGQYMMVLEDYNAAIIFTGSNYGNWRGKLPFEILMKYLIPLFESKK